MYALIKTGGKQWKVSPGKIIRVEKLEGSVGVRVEINEVLMISKDGEVKIGTPFIPNAKVLADVVEQGKAKKIIVFKRKRRKGYRKKMGHRQPYTGLRIMEIVEQ